MLHLLRISFIKIVLFGEQNMRAGTLRVIRDECSFYRNVPLLRCIFSVIVVCSLPFAASPAAPPLLAFRSAFYFWPNHNFHARTMQTSSARGCVVLGVRRDAANARAKMQKEEGETQVNAKEGKSEAFACKYVQNSARFSGSSILFIHFVFRKRLGPEHRKIALRLQIDGTSS